MPEINRPDIKIPTINALTGLRGIAALWVVIFHIWVGMGEPNVTAYGMDITPFFIGEFGVDIFFVLSGFVVFLPCAYALRYKLRISWRDFYIRRVARLFPAYHVQLFFIFLLFTSGLYASDLSVLDVLKHIFMLQNFPAEGSTQILGVYWTLPVEMNFYLSIPILFYVIKRFGILLCLFLGISTCIAYRYFIFGVYGNNEFLWLQVNQLIGRLDAFMIGISAAIIYTRFNKNNIFYTTIKDNDWIGIAIGIMAILSCIYYLHLNGAKQYYYTGNDLLFFFNTLLAVSIGILIISLTFEGKIGVALLSNPPIVFLGTISYGIYLWHPLVFTLLIDHFPLMIKMNFLQEGLLGICVTIAVASLSYFFVEKPILNIVKRNLSKDLFGGKTPTR